MLRKTIIAAAIFGLLAGAVQAEDEKVGIAGKVLDENNRPVKHALVVIRDRDTQATVHVVTDGHGRYAAQHVPGARCLLQVVPPEKSGLAQAILPDVPADEGRHVLVKVHKGFVVHGRTLFDGKPVRGALIRVLSDDTDTIHGGGETTTDWHGGFSLVVTPGNKIIEVSNITAPGSVGAFRTNYSVSADSTISDIALPRNVASRRQTK
jgi:hypothetical protein